MNTILQKRIEEAAANHKAYAEEFRLKSDTSFICGVDWYRNHQWISVEEALPEEKFDNGYEFVFVIVKIDEETSYYDTDYIRNGKWELHVDEVTHWMSIPQLKGGKDE